ncbi:hypothetical protein F7R01_10215 [Pseudomonas argentinensis]|nr:hypothetical protein [Pseudomonas argentinensis]KAB0547869.1 hypothetical protein F7R01_10215 [Pseudomonas argentinensis]
MTQVAVLFARSDSIYKTLSATDVWDAQRNALNWPGGAPVVAHPPCRAWGRLRTFAKPRPGEKELALWAVDKIRSHGGVLEHPASSLLWKEKPLPEPGEQDDWNGWTLVISQWWWGHRAEKLTRLYICGAKPSELPPMPYRMGEASHVIAQSSLNQHLRRRPEVSKKEREATPVELATWLIEVARICGSNIAAERHTA